MVVLSVEGPGFIDKGTWTTHKVLGVFPDRAAATAAVPDDGDDEDIYLITDLDTNKATRVEIVENDG